MSVLGTISEITIFPIKSFGGIKLEKAIITKYGISHPDNPDIADRKLMVVKENGNLIGQRQVPKLALIKPLIDRNDFVLTAPGKQPIKVPINGYTSNKIKCKLHNLWIDGYAYDDEINKWISDFIEKENCFLVTFANDLEPRKSKLLDYPSNNSRDDDLIMYPDFSPLMLISENSLNDLNSRLENKVSMSNFRPNFIAKDCDAFAEDDWLKFSIGESKFTKIKICTRCILVTVDQEKGIKDPNEEPLKTLNTYRKNKVYGASPMFGIYFAPDNIGTVISVGDKILNIEA